MHAAAAAAAAAVAATLGAAVERWRLAGRTQVATTCLFLASKVEETPKKLKDVVIETYKVQHSTVQPPDAESQELWRLKEQILICERELLRVLGFDLSVEHAYRRGLATQRSAAATAAAVTHAHHPPTPSPVSPLPTSSCSHQPSLGRATAVCCRPLLAYIKSICGTRDLAQIAWNFSTAWPLALACARLPPPTICHRPSRIRQPPSAF